MSQSSTNLAFKLGNIQKHLKAPKNQDNKFGGYKYRNCEDILEALKPLLDDQTTVIITDDIVMIGDRFYVKATAIISDGDHSIESTAFAREAAINKGMDESQITGAASSYARKYALNGLFLIDDTKDADFNQGKGSKELTDNDRAWIEGIKNKSLKPSQIEDEEYRGFIMEHVLND